MTRTRRERGTTTHTSLMMVLVLVCAFASACGSSNSDKLASLNGGEGHLRLSGDLDRLASYRVLAGGYQPESRSLTVGFSEGENSFAFVGPADAPGFTL